MTVTNNIFPQSGDADFAENFATWLGRGNISSYVETGLSITPDYTTSPPTIDISQGKSFVIIDEATISSNGETRLALDYAVTTEGATNLSVNANESNNLIYLNPNLGTNDSPSFEVETSTSGAAAEWLLIARVDTVAESATQLNRNPDADFDALTARESFGLPVYSEFSEASSSEASTIYIDGSGAPQQGVYVNDGGSFTPVGVKEISQLTDVIGVDSITADSSTNRPAAGTQGRIFIDTTNEKIQYDTGSVWEDIGTNAENIGAGDLGFDPATQTELDTHASDNDIHHSRPVAGNGLKDQSNNFNIEPSDFAGLFLNDDSDNLEVQIGTGLENDGSGQIQFDEAESYTFSSQQIINGILTMGADIDLSNNNLVEPNQIETSGSGSDVITVRDTSSASDILTLSEGGTVAVTSGDLTNGGTTTIFDQSASHVPLSALENDSVTIGAGDGLKNGGTITLGSSTTLNIEPNDFAGSGLVDDGADNLALAADSITVSANDGLKSGGTVSLGGSVGLDIEPADFAGTFLSDDGSDNLQVNIGAGLESDGANNIRLDEDFDATFTSTIDFSAGLDTQANITDGTQVIWDATAGEIPDSALGAIDNSTLANDSITISAGNNLSGGGTVALGGNITLNATDTRADVSDNTTLIESNVTDINFSSNLDVSTDGDGSVRVDAASSTDTTTDISENGATVVNQTTDINFEDNIDVVDDGDGSVTINASDTDTRVDVSDSGTFIGINTSEINFSSNLDVSTNDGGSTVTVDAQSSTDTTTDISENGTTVVNQTTDINFEDNIDVVDDGDGSVTVNATDTNTIPSVDDSGSFITNNASGFNFGSNLSVTDNGGGNVTIDASDTDTIPSVDDSGSLITNNASGFNFGSNLSVTDNGGGNVTIDASDTDTRVDVSDSGTAIGFNTSEINFSSNLDVSTNDGGSTIVVDAQSSTDTTTDVSENGTTIISQTDDINFTDGGGGNVSVSDDTDGTATVNIDHADTSSQATLNASAGAAITDITLDEYGHITEMGDTDFDSRFVRESGDTMSGQLTTTGVVFNDSNNDGDEWTIQENGSSGNLTIDDSVSVRMTVDQSGNVDIEGELTEGAVL